MSAPTANDYAAALALIDTLRMQGLPASVWEPLDVVLDVARSSVAAEAGRRRWVVAKVGSSEIAAGQHAEADARDCLRAAIARLVVLATDADGAS